MRNTYLAKAGLLGLALAAVCSASAQSIGLSPRIGIVLPTSSDGGSAFGIGADYKLAALPGNVSAGGTATYWGASIDYYAHGGFSNLPLALTFNFSSQGLTFDLGAGIEFTKTGGGDGSGLDLQAGVTYTLGHMPVPAFLQAKYFLSSRSQLRGIGLYVGVKL